MVMLKLSTVVTPESVVKLPVSASPLLKVTSLKVQVTWAEADVANPKTIVARIKNFAAFLTAFITTSRGDTTSALYSIYTYLRKDFRLVMNVYFCQCLWKSPPERDVPDDAGSLSY